MKISHTINEQKLAIVTLHDSLLVDQVPIAEKYLFDLEQDDNVLGVVLNFKYTAFIDSSGVGTLATLYKKLTVKKKYFAICQPKRNVLKILKMIGFDKIFPIYPTEEEAISGYQKKE